MCLSPGDLDRLLEEFGEAIRLLTFTRFSVDVQDAQTDTSFVSGDVHWTYLGPPHRWSIWILAQPWRDP